MDYAMSEGIITQTITDTTELITRGELALLLVKIFDSEELETINIVDDGTILDVPMESKYAEAVYQLYRAGIIIGKNTNDEFSPDAFVTHQELSEILERMIYPSKRLSFELTGAY